MAASRLLVIAEVLGVPTASLLPTGSDVRSGGDTSHEDVVRDILCDPQGVSLARNFMRLPPAQKRAIANLVTSLASGKIPVAAE